MPNLYPELLHPVHDTVNGQPGCVRFGQTTANIYMAKNTISKLLLLRFCHLNLLKLSRLKAGLSEEKNSLMPCLRTFSNVLF